MHNIINAAKYTTENNRRVTYDERVSDKETMNEAEEDGLVPHD